MRDWTLHLVTARGQLAPHEDAIRRAVAAALRFTLEEAFAAGDP